MAYQKVSTGAYSSGGSYAINLSEQVDIRTQEQVEANAGPILETRYYCEISASVMIKFDTGTERGPKAEKVRLVGEDGKDYKLQYWTADEYGDASKAALAATNVQVKTNWGTGPPT